MIRLALLLCIACVCAARPAFSQQAAPPAAQSTPPAAQSNELRDLLDARFCEAVSDGDHIKMTGGLCGGPVDSPVEMPIPKQQGVRLFADTVEIFFDKNLLIAEGSVAFTTTEGRINADRIEFNLEDGTAKFYKAQGIMRFPNAGRADFVSQDPDVYFSGDLVERLSLIHI